MGALTTVLALGVRPRFRWRWALALAVVVAILKTRIAPMMLQLVFNVAGLATGRVRIVSIAGRWTLTSR